MPLILTLAGTRDTRTVNRGTLSIGRGSSNDWVLADPERHLSKTHCFIAFAAGRYVLTDVSTNGVFINGSRERVPRDGEVVLNDGDEVRIGEYVIGVAEAAGGGGASRPAEDPLADPRDSGIDPLAGDPLEDPFAAPPPAGFVHKFAVAAPVLRAEDPFDRADEAGHRSSHDPDDDLFRGVAPSEEWQGPSQPDTADAPRHALIAPRLAAPMSFDDIDALLGDVPPGAPAAAASKPQPVSPPVAEPSPEPPRPVPVAKPAAAATAIDPAPLLAAFLDGAGVSGLELGTDPEAAMRNAGAVFRALVEGLRQVLISRAAIKNEFRVEQTMLQARDNNPIKFSVTEQDAVAALLQPGRPGYKPPLAAAQEAFDDVRSHELAVMAGVQTALMGLLRRFEPGSLEKRLAPGMIDTILPGARRARTWELFCATYKDIVREAEDDFQAVFGREFARAYHAQVRKP